MALLAPLTAELLQAYLGDLGGPVGLVVFVLFLAPLYGGAALLAFGGVLARTLIGFPAPLPQQTTWPEKLFQNVSYLVIVLVLGAALARRTRGDAASYPTMGA